MLHVFFFFYRDGGHRDLHVLTHSFPTRRSSDLAQGHGSIRKTVIPALLAASILTGMAPGDMSIAAFLARADRVMRFGPLAMATPEAYRLKNEVVATAKRYKARIDAQRRAGQQATRDRESGVVGKSV